MNRDYKAHCTESGLAASTTAAYVSDAAKFSSYMKGDLSGVTIDRVVEWLDSSGATTPTRRRKIHALRHYFAFLGIEDPTALMALGGKARKASGGSISQDELDRIVRQVDIGSYMGVRDQAMIYTYFATGLRSSELVNLTMDKVADTADGLFVEGCSVSVRLSGSCAASMRLYLNSSRAEMLRGRTSNYVFVTWFGKPMIRQALWRIVQKHAYMAGVKRNLRGLVLEAAGADVPTRALSMSPVIRKIEAFLEKHPEVESTFLLDRVLDELEMKLASVRSTSHPKLSESKVVSTQVPWSKP